MRLSDEDSEATFSSSTRTSIRSKYKNRCAICLNLQTKPGSRCAHLLDKADYLTGVELGTLPGVYELSDAENALVQCGTCLSLFRSNHVILSPPHQVLQYISDYLNSPGTVPLYEFLTSLVDQPANSSIHPAIIPYLGIYTLVPLKSEELRYFRIPTNHFRSLSMLHEGNFIVAPVDASGNDFDRARIFDSFNLKRDATAVSGSIPLSPVDLGYNEQRYWRIPIGLPVILTILLQRTILLPPRPHEVSLAQNIFAKLTMQRVKPPMSPETLGGKVSGDCGKDGGARSEKGDELLNHSGKGAKQIRDLDLDAGGSANDGTDSFYSDSGEANPEAWESGPSYSGNRIIFESRGIVLC